MTFIPDSQYQEQQGSQPGILQSLVNTFFPQTQKFGQELATNPQQNMPQGLLEKLVLPYYMAKHASQVVPMGGEILPWTLPVGGATKGLLPGGTSLITGAIRGASRPLTAPNQTLGQRAVNTGVGAATGALTENYLTKLFNAAAPWLFGRAVPPQVDTSASFARQQAEAEQTGLEQTTGITPRQVGMSLEKRIKDLGNQLQDLLGTYSDKTVKYKGGGSNSLESQLDETLSNVSGFDPLSRKWTNLSGQVKKIIENAGETTPSTSGEADFILNPESLNKAKQLIGKEVNWTRVHMGEAKPLDKVYAAAYDFLKDKTNVLTKNEIAPLNNTIHKLQQIVPAVAKESKAGSGSMGFSPSSMIYRKTGATDPIFLLLSRIMQNQNLRPGFSNLLRGGVAGSLSGEQPQ